MTSGARRKVGDIFADLGKYVLTAVPIAYFVASNHEVFWISLSLIALWGILFCYIGVYIVNTADKLEEHKANHKGKLHKVKLQKNTIISIEEL